jgi:C-terminal processing protease CtpA/Prc
MTNLTTIDGATGIGRPPQPRRRRPLPALARAHGAGTAGDDAHLPLRRAVLLKDFLRRRRALSIDDCRRLVQQALVLFESIYVHLPMKRSMYAVDPVRRLRLLDHRLAELAEAQRKRKRRRRPDDLWFHREMSDIFTSVRDLHTVYLLPRPFEGAVALLPFQIEDYFVGDERRYLVSNVLSGLDWSPLRRDFVPGVEVTHWNGMPIARAVELVGASNPGSNPEARHARGLARFTIRPLLKSVPPDEESVIVRYRKGPKAPSRELRVEWRVARLEEGRDAPPDGAPLRQAMGRGLDLETDKIGIIRKRMWVPKVLEDERRLARKRKSRSRDKAAPRREEIDDTIAGGQVIKSDMPGIFQAKIRKIRGKAYGYIRIRSFNVGDADAFLKEFVELVEHMPPNGLIIDVRDNGGGNIEAGERILQVLTPRRIEPERLQFINTPLNLLLCRRYEDLQPWVESMERAVETGTIFSAGFPHSSPEACNDIGQRYYGPVVLVTNALCYSTTDIFSAGFQDHEIGPVLGTDGNTGAGGANVVSHADLVGMMSGRKGVPLRGSPFRPLPGNANLRVAIRRTVRVGTRSGTELEDIGVTPDIPYRMSRRDVLEGNRDLIAKAATILAEKPSYDLREVKIVRGAGVLKIEIRTRNLDRLDIVVDEWAMPSRRVRDGDHTVEVPLPPGGRAKTLQLSGYRERRLVAARKVALK